MLTLAVASVAWILAAACAEQSSSRTAGEPELPAPTSATDGAEGFVLRAGEGEVLQNGIVVKASPATGTLGSILVEQSFPRGGTTNLHLHEQGDELFYVVSGRGTATLGDTTNEVGPGDVIFVPRNAVHRVQNLDRDEPLRVAFFMDSPELVEQFRAIHERVTSEPDRPITDDERAAISERIGGGRAVGP
jgi:quercetin dioxygenase-like cupin family protein